MRKICTVPDIIQEFMKKWEGEEASFSKQTMDDISLSEPVDKFKAKIVGECSGVVTQDLLPRFVVGRM